MTQLNVFFEMVEMPVFCNLLWPNQHAAQQCERGDIRLAFCPQTGLITNVAFDPTRLQYSHAYENALDFSPRFQDYARSLAERLIHEHQLYRKDIIEIGCGKGEFLRLLCQLGDNRGVGFDPSYVELPESSEGAGQMTVVQDVYSERYAHYASDFICCRHTLEHIQDPTTLLRTLRRAIDASRPEPVVFFEVPNALDTFRHLAIWDIIYEHCCYFAPVALAAIFAACGFRVHKLNEEYGGQFLCLEARPGPNTAAEAAEQHAEWVQQLARDVTAFKTRFDHKVQTWNHKLHEMSRKRQRVVVWGAGSKGVTFLNLLEQQDQVEYVVDINPRKQGMYIPGTGQKIVPPELLRVYQPDVVCIMNAIYTDEIRQMCQGLGLHPELMSV